MSRFSSFIIAAVVSLSLGYYLLSSYYSPLLNWLGPVFGSDMYFSLGLLVLVMGNPFSYALVFVSWLLIGITIGITARRILRSISITISIYFFLWGVIIGSLFSYFISFVPSLAAGGGSLSGLDGLTGVLNLVPPPGTNLASILFEPVLYQVFLKFLSIHITSGSPIKSAVGSFEGLFYGPIISFVICAGSAGVVSHFIKELAESGGGGKGSRSINRSLKPALVFLIAILLVIILTTSVVAVPFQYKKIDETTLSSSDQYEQQLDCKVSVYPNMSISSLNNKTSVAMDLTLISHNGNLYNLCYAENNQTSIPMESMFPNLESSYLILDSNVEDMGFIFGSVFKVSGLGINLDSLLNLVPGGILVTYISTSCIDQENCADKVSQAYDNMTGESFFLLVNDTAFGVSLPSLFSQNGSQFIFLSGDQFTGSSTNLTSYVSSLSYGGISSIMENTIGNRLRQDNNHYPTADALILGYTSTGSIPFFSSSDLNTTSIPTLRGSSNFALNFHVDFGALNTSALPYLPMHDITGFNDAFNLSCRTKSIIEILTPKSDTSSTNLSSGYCTTIYALNGTSSSNRTYHGDNMTLIPVDDNYEFQPDMELMVNSTLPPPLHVDCSVTSTNGKISVEFTVTNMGNASLGEAVMTDSYGEVVSPGSLSVRSVNVSSGPTAVPGGSSISLSLIENDTNPGVYVISGPLLSFTYGGSKFYEVFSPVIVRVGKENVFSAVAQYYGLIIFSIASYFTRISLSTSILLAYVVTILLLIYAVYSQYDDFRKWREKRKSV